MSNLMTLDEFTYLCSTCGSIHLTGDPSARTDGTVGCRQCGAVPVADRTVAEIALLVGAGDSMALRKQRRAIVAKSRRATKSRKANIDSNGASADTQRSAFLASVGAVPIPVGLYALWLDTLLAQAPGVSLRSHDLGLEDSAEWSGGELYSRRRDRWMPTLPFQLDEVPVLHGASAFTLLVPPHLAAGLTAHGEYEAAVDIGHNQVDVLRHDGTEGWTTWTSRRPAFDTSPAVEVLRADRDAMRMLSRQWSSCANSASLWALVA